MYERRLVGVKAFLRNRKPTLLAARENNGSTNGKQQREELADKPNSESVPGD